MIDRKQIKQNVIQTYQGNIEANSEEKASGNAWKRQSGINEMLWQTNGVTDWRYRAGDFRRGELSKSLNLSETSVMGDAFLSLRLTSTFQSITVRRRILANG